MQYMRSLQMHHKKNVGNLIYKFWIVPSTLVLCRTDPFTNATRLIASLVSEVHKVLISMDLTYETFFKLQQKNLVLLNSLLQCIQAY